MHVRKNQQAKFLPNIHCVNSKVVFQFRNGNKPVQLKQANTHGQLLLGAVQPAFIIKCILTAGHLLKSGIKNNMWDSLTFLSTISLPWDASELPYAMARLDMGSDRKAWPENPAAWGSACWFLPSWNETCSELFYLSIWWKLNKEQSRRCKMCLFFSPSDCYLLT